MDIVIDLTSYYSLMEQSPWVLLSNLFFGFGWIPVSIVMLWGFKEVWMNYIQDTWSGQQKKVFLAIDIPRSNAQSPMAVENMFSYLAGAHSTTNLIEKYWDGEIQPGFSFETISIDGYTQFVVRTYVKYRDVFETALYSQYPDAEITEIEDYTADMPRKFPDEEWDIFGMEFIQVKDQAFPIKTYEEFEHQMGEPETTFRDPMSTLMNLYGSLKKGEQIWFQMLVKPIDMNEWAEKSEKEVRKILKEETKSSKNIADAFGDIIIKILYEFSEMVYSMWGDIEDKKEDKKEDALKMMNLKPKEKKQVEAIQDKASKIGFAVKIRTIYWAKKEVMNKPKFFSGMVGFMKQFASIDLNSFKPDMKRTATKAHYFFKEDRVNAKKRKIVQNYMKRDTSAGRTPGVLNTEELATIWHFPIESSVKAPLISKAPGRKAEPPSNIPIGEEMVSDELFMPTFEEEILGKKSQRQIERDFIPEVKKPAVPGFMEPAKLSEIKVVEERGKPPANLPFV